MQESDSIFEKAKEHFFLGLDHILKEHWLDAERELRISLGYVPNRVSTLTNLCATLIKLKSFQEASDLVEQTWALDPKNPELLLNQGLLFSEERRYEEALASYERSIELKPDYAEAWSNRGDALNCLKHHEEAAKSYLKAHKLTKFPNFDLGKCHHQMMLACDWTDYDLYKNEIDSGVKDGKHYALPFGYQGIADSEALLRKCAELYCQKRHPTATKITPKIKNSEHKIRIGYLCGEFRDQATSHLMTGVWESHDRRIFEVFAFDSGWDDQSDYRSRVESAIPNFFTISRTSDLKVAELVVNNNIDILVNLNGYFGQNRQNVFAVKPAPIAVNYLGFPGTIDLSGFLEPISSRNAGSGC